MELMKEKWTGKINCLTIGAGKEEGGTRTSTVTVGGETALPFLFFEGKLPYKPVIAMEVFDKAPVDWPLHLTEPFKDVLGRADLWAKKCVEEYGAELICLRLASIHPDEQDTSAEEASETVKSILKAVGVPLIIWGCGHAQKDNEVLPLCSEVLAGEKCLFGTSTQDNYKTLAASCQADSHSVIAESPIDINIAKQVNILLSEMGLPLERIAIYPMTSGLGYGLEYAYSIMERSRLAGLSGDTVMSLPMVAVAGWEVWRTKEAKASVIEYPQWGDEKERGVIWEALSAMSFLNAGADILVMLHPKAVGIVRSTIDQLYCS